MRLPSLTGGVRFCLLSAVPGARRRIVPLVRSIHGQQSDNNVPDRLPV